MHLIDLHCDTLSAILDKQQGLFRNTCHFDLERALAGGLKYNLWLYSWSHRPTAALEKVCRQMEYYQEQLHINRVRYMGLNLWKIYRSTGLKIR